VNVVRHVDGAHGHSWYSAAALSGTLLAVVWAATFVLATYLCYRVRGFAQRRALLDHPNERSLHQIPVPRLGGVAIGVATWTVICVWFWHTGVKRDVLAWLLCSFLVALLGLIDDVRPLSARARLLLQIGVAVVFCSILGVFERVTLMPGFAVLLPPTLVLALSVVGIVGILNIYNFMDGMDGLAGCQAVGAGLALGIGAHARGHDDLAAIAVVTSAAAAGFLLHNMPPAKIFMGDAGSTFLGFTFAAFAVIGLRRIEPLPLSMTACALAPFLLDGLFTLLRRLWRREAIWLAHRSHLYQRAVATGLTHREVLEPYCAWIAVAFASAAVAASADTATTAGLVVTMLAALGVVWRWVVRRERAAERGPNAH
jgi:UDP-N-acetylmuramyl pentapeptide phosphotransferase/UDP-N-acetylglucosamine-1-phosphate transferase